MDYAYIAEKMILYNKFSTIPTTAGKANSKTKVIQNIGNILIFDLGRCFF